MKILVADRIADAGIELFRQQPGAEVVLAWEAMPDWEPKKHPEQVVELVQKTNPNAIAVRSDTTISADVIKVAPELRVVGRAGVGVDNIDIDAATDVGVIVMNTPGGNTIATAELTFTHMLCGTRPIVQAHQTMREGRWDRKKFKGVELYEKTLGICGLGRIGTEVARRAKAFGMSVVAFDPYLTEGRAETIGIRKVELNELFSTADYITVHMPLTEQTKHLIDEAAFEKMKDGVRVFNCARGGIIKEEALIEALKSGKCAAAGMDVYEDEPPSEDHPFRSLENMVLTPHLGASTQEAQENVGIEIAEQMVEAMNGGIVRNALNMPSVDPSVLEELQPYLTLGEALGNFAQQLAGDNIEALKIGYFGKIVNLDATPLSRAIQRGFLRTVADNVNDVNAPKKMAELGVKVDVTKSNEETEFTEFIEVEAIEKGGKTRTVGGTLFGKNHVPRIVEIDHHGVEVNCKGVLLVIKNTDVPGIIGFIGTSMGKYEVNIANLSLARDQGEGFAISVYELDSVPPTAAVDEISQHPAIEKLRIIRL